jgi:hypothetical protein
MKEKDNEILQKEQARHIMLAPLRGQQLKNYVTGIRNQLNSERTAEKKAAYNEAVTKFVFACLIVLAGVDAVRTPPAACSDWLLSFVSHFPYAVPVCVQGQGAEGEAVRSTAQGAGG